MELEPWTKIRKVLEKFWIKLTKVFCDLLNVAPLESSLKKKFVSSIVYPTKSVILKNISRLRTLNRELTQNLGNNRVLRQVFIP